MLHVHGGSVLLEHIRAAGIPGERLEWGEMLCVGPTPAGLDLETWRATRAAFLEETSERLLEADRRLERAARTEDEIVLWFGPELFCQAILIAILDRLADAGARLCLISLDQYPGVQDYRGCTPSYLNASQLLEVFRLRPEVTPAQRALAREAWAVWCHATPDRLAALARTTLPALPFLSPALRRQLEELPSQAGGLSRTERTVLEVLGSGPIGFGELFRAVQDREERPWLSDTILLRTLRHLAQGPTPLIEGAKQLRRTSVGAEVAAGRQDAVQLRGIDRWVGGTHLTPGTCWRWEAVGSRLIPPSAGG